MYKHRQAAWQGCFPDGQMVYMSRSLGCVVSEEGGYDNMSPGTFPSRSSSRALSETAQVYRSRPIQGHKEPKVDEDLVPLSSTVVFEVMEEEEEDCGGRAREAPKSGSIRLPKQMQHSSSDTESGAQSEAHGSKD